MPYAVAEIRNLACRGLAAYRDVFFCWKNEGQTHHVCQQVALSLLQVFRLHPEPGLARRRPGAAARVAVRGRAQARSKVIDRFWHRCHAAASLEGLDSEPADGNTKHTKGSVERNSFRS